MSFEGWMKENADTTIENEIFYSADMRAAWNAAIDEVVNILKDTGTLSEGGTTLDKIRELKS